MHSENSDVSTAGWSGGHGSDDITIADMKVTGIALESLGAVAVEASLDLVDDDVGIAEIALSLAVCRTVTTVRVVWAVVGPGSSRIPRRYY